MDCKLERRQKWEAGRHGDFFVFAPLREFFKVKILYFKNDSKNNCSF